MGLIILIHTVMYLSQKYFQLLQGSSVRSVYFYQENKQGFQECMRDTWSLTLCQNHSTESTRLLDKNYTSVKPCFWTACLFCTIGWWSWQLPDSYVPGWGGSERVRRKCGAFDCCEAQCSQGTTQVHGRRMLLLDIPYPGRGP